MGGMGVPHIFGPLTGAAPIEVPASYLDDNFNFVTAPTTNAISYGVVADDATDNAIALQAALTAAGTLGGGIVDLPQGIIRYSTVLTIPNGVTLRGCGDVNPSHNGTAPTRLRWVGGTGATIKLGRQGVGTLYFGGGISNIMFENYSGQATFGIDIRDIQSAVFENLAFRFFLTAQIYLSNTTNGGGQEPTSGLIFRNVWLGAAGGAHGIMADGQTAGGTEGLTNNKFKDCVILHANGDGINLGLSNDGFKYDNVFFFGTGSGYSVHWSSLNANQSSGFQYFFACFFATGLFVAHPIAGVGSLIVGNGDSTDGSVSPVNMVLGAGAFNVSQIPSYNGKLFGAARTHGYRDTIHHDSMAFVTYVSASTVLHTADGNWLTSVDAAGNLTDAAVWGGATVLTTGNVSGRVTTIMDTALGSGIIINALPQMTFAMFHIGTLSNQKVRAGLLNDVGDPPANGIYIEANQDNSSFFQAVTANGGTRTTTNTNITIDTTTSQWRIECTGSSINFWQRPGGSELWSLRATNTTNIPTSAFPLSCVFTCKTGTNAFKQVAISDFRRAFNVEV